MTDVAESTEDPLAVNGEDSSVPELLSIVEGLAVGKELQVEVIEDLIEYFKTQNRKFWTANTSAGWKVNRLQDDEVYDLIERIKNDLSLRNQAIEELNKLK